MRVFLILLRKKKNEKQKFLEEDKSGGLAKIPALHFISQRILINSRTSLPELHAPHCPGWLSLQTKDKYCWNATSFWLKCVSSLGGIKVSQIISCLILTINRKLLPNFPTLHWHLQDFQDSWTLEIRIHNSLRIFLPLSFSLMTICHLSPFFLKWEKEN